MLNYHHHIKKKNNTVHLFFFFNYCDIFLLTLAAVKSASSICLQSTTTGSLDFPILTAARSVLPRIKSTAGK